MRLHLKMVPTAVAAFLAAGCQSSQPPAGDAQLSSSSAEAKTPVEDPAAFPADRTATLWVKGLACPYCVNNIDRQLTGMKGVQRVHVDLPTGEVRVLLLTKNSATQGQLIKAIDDSGFTLDRIEMPQ